MFGQYAQISDDELGYSSELSDILLFLPHMHGYNYVGNRFHCDKLSSIWDNGTRTGKIINNRPFYFLTMDLVPN